MTVFWLPRFVYNLYFWSDLCLTRVEKGADIMDISKGMMPRKS